jgi:hypothetical protein
VNLEYILKKYIIIYDPYLRKDSMTKKTGSHKRKHIKCGYKGCTKNAGTIPIKDKESGKMVTPCPRCLGEIQRNNEK